MDSYFAVQRAVPPPFRHQTRTTEFILAHDSVYIGNDPGTGKTRSCLDAIAAMRGDGGGKTLVFAPKAILASAWAEDCAKFTPHLRLSVATAANRAEAFAVDADIYVTNHDASKWVAEHERLLEYGFDMLIGDEATAYKNRTAQRSKAMNKIRRHFKRIVMMCGTPMPQGLEDLWHQYYLLDAGERLGHSFYSFRYHMHEPEQITGHPQAQKWNEKEGAREAVADLIADITIIYKLEECIDMPEQSFHDTDIDLTPTLLRRYRQMADNALIELHGNVNITAVHAASLRTKLLQICSGAVYDGTGNYHVFDTARYELIAQMCLERECTLVAFWWRHQRDELLKALKKAGVDRVGVIDGSTKDVQQVVTTTQAGGYQAVLVQPKSGSHGLTLTRAKTTIWASPTYEAEKYTQINHRTYRVGQFDPTEVIHIRARDTVEHHAYERLRGKIANETAVVDLLRALGAHHKEPECTTT